MQTISSALLQAQQNHARGNLPFAILLYRKVLQAEPRNYTANYSLAVALYQSGQLKTSVRFFDAAAAADPHRLEVHKDRGLVLLKLGAFSAAESSFSHALRIDPLQPELHVNRGIALNRLGRVEKAIESYRAALRLTPELAEAHNNLGNSLSTLGRTEEALAHFERAIAMKPAYVEAWFGAGNVLLGLKRHAEAMQHFQKVLEISPRHADAHHAIALTLIEQNLSEQVEAALAKALAIDPQHAGALLTRGTLRQREGKLEEALADYDSSLAVMPASVEALVRKAGILRRKQQLDDAVALYDKAIALEPENTRAYYGIGRSFFEKKEFNAAAMSFDAAIKHQPDVADYHYGRGRALQPIDYYEEALASFEKAVELKPDFPQAHLSAASIYALMNRNEEALTALETVRRLMPGEDHYVGRRFIEKMKMCFWADAEAELREIVSQIEAGKPAIDPLSALHYLDLPSLQQRCAELSIAEIEKWALPPNKPAVVTRDSRMVIGYYSGDFRQHATMVLISEVFERHDRERFRFVAFSLKKAQGSEKRKRVMSCFEAFHDMDHKLDREIIDVSRQENVNVAVDLMGHTRFSRPTAFMAGVAPIQVSMLGFPGTMGTVSMDYLIADPVLIPEEMREFYTEKVAYLPNSYQPNDRKREISDRVFTREELRLPGDAFVFCCFNQNFKISPDVFAGWMRIMQQAPESVLWLLAYSKSVSKNLRDAAEAHGVDPGRLVFAEPLPLPDHLARHRLADLFLDTLPYNAHTTGSDALWAGLPVLTRMGQSFASRVGASLISAAGLPELITTSAEEYEQLALRLYRDRNTLAALRQRLAANRLTCPLFDTERYTRDLETLYSKMVDRHERGLPPDHLFV
jgi:protein O-GlcNAc transferase